MGQHLQCRLIKDPNREQFEIKFPRRFTEDPHKFGAVCGRFERELGIRTRVSHGDGRQWTIPYSWFRALPTTERIVQVLRETFSICLSMDLEVEVTEIESGPVFDPVTDQVVDDDEPLVDGLALSPGDLP